MDQATEIGDPSTDAPVVAADEPAPRALTARALLIGGVVAAAVAVLTPWNDWYLGNTYLFSDYMPPVVTALLLITGVAINPLLGARRLRTGELAVITTLVLGVGGVASSGLMRLWPAAVAGPARYLARQQPATLKARLSPAELAATRAAAQRALAERFARLDADRDGRLSPAEADVGDGFAAADVDHHGALSPDEYARWRIAHDPSLAPDWRWDLPSGLFLGVPASGDVHQDDPEYQHVVDGYLDGLPHGSEPRVAHRARVTWIDAGGARHERQLALGGAELRAHPGALSLDDEVGRALAGAKAGAEVAVPGGLARVVAVEPPSPPWYAWIAPLARWAPLLLGTVVASVAIAFLVRRQWIENERLPYPVAAVSLALMAEPAPGRRLAPVLRERGFWYGFAIAAAIVAWRGLFRWHLVSVDFITDLDLIYPDNAPFHAGSAWNAMEPGFLFHPTLYFSLFALAFFLPLDLSFSLWASFIAANLVAWALKDRLGMGATVTWANCRSVGYGAFLAMAPLIVWLGRGFYGRVVRAAFGRGDPAARAAAPFLWAALAGAAAIAAFFVANGAPIAAALLCTALFLASLLVISRVLAEAGVPFLQVPLSIDSPLFTLLGFGMPAGPLVALATVGFTLLPDGRESLMPFATDASFLGHRSRVPAKRLAGLMMGAAAIGIVLALASMLWNSYTATGHRDGWIPYWYELSNIADRRADLQNPAGAAQLADGRGQALGAYGIGAGLVVLCGVGRMLSAAWPLHPLAWCVTFTYPGAAGWFSFFAAWLSKALTMRYGGVGLYKRLKPVAIGLIAGEALAMAAFIAVKIVAKLCDVSLESYNALPG